jgi:hypothetical protein
VSWTSYKRSVATAKAKAAAFQEWREMHDPALAAKKAERAAKEIATLKVLAEKHGFDLVAKKAGDAS